MPEGQNNQLIQVNDLKTWNGLGNDTLLHPGQSLKIVR